MGLLVYTLICRNCGETLVSLDLGEVFEILEDSLGSPESVFIHQSGDEEGVFPLRVDYSMQAELVDKILRRPEVSWVRYVFEEDEYLLCVGTIQAVFIPLVPFDPKMN